MLRRISKAPEDRFNRLETEKSRYLLKEVLTVMNQDGSYRDKTRRGIRWVKRTTRQKFLRLNDARNGLGAIELTMGKRLLIAQELQEYAESSPLSQTASGQLVSASLPHLPQL